MAISIKETKDQIVIEYRFTTGRYLFLGVGISFIILSPVFISFFPILGIIFLLVGIFVLFGAKEAGKKQVLIINNQSKEIKYERICVVFSEIRKIYLRAIGSGTHSLHIIGRPAIQIICEKNNGDTVTLLPTDSNVNEKIKVLEILKSKGLPVTFDTEVD